MRTVETKVYRYDELTPEAKERARYWWFGVSDIELDHVVDDFDVICQILGLEIERERVPLMGGGTREKPDVNYSIGGSSDWASFSGHYSYRPKALAEIKSYAPRDNALHAIALTLQQTQRKAFYSLSASVHSSRRGGILSVHVEHEHRDVSEDEQGTLEGVFDDLQHYLRSALAREYAYQMSDEYIEEAMLANEYEFTEKGERYDG